MILVRKTWRKTRYDVNLLLLQGFQARARDTQQLLNRSMADEGCISVWEKHVMTSIENTINSCRLAPLICIREVFQTRMHDCMYAIIRGTVGTFTELGSFDSFV